MANLSGLKPIDEGGLSGLKPLEASAPTETAETLQGLTEKAEGLTGLAPVESSSGIGGEEPASPQEIPLTTGTLALNKPGVDIPNFQPVPGIQLTPEEVVTQTRHDEVIAATGQAQKDQDDQFTFLQRQGNRLAMGQNRRVAESLSARVGGMATELSAIENGDEYVIQRAIAKSFTVGVPPKPGTPEYAERLAEYTANLRQQLEQTRVEYTATIDAVLNPQVSNKAGEVVDLPPSAVMQAIAEAGAAGDDELVNRLMLEFFGTAAAETALPSITQAGPKQVIVPFGAAAAASKLNLGRTGTVAAFAGASGFVSGLTEFDASFSEFMRDEGVDLSDVHQVEEALQDRDIVRRGRAFALKRGLSVALWDMAGAYIAANKWMPPGLKNKIAQQFTNAGAQFVGQVGTGIAGEVTAQAVAGQEFDPTAAKLEGLGEVPQAVIEPTVFKLAQKLGLAPAELMSTNQVLDAYLKNPNVTIKETLAVLKEVAANGMTDTEARALMKIVAPLADTGEVLDNTHSLNNRFDKVFQEAVRRVNFEDVEGNTVLAEEILDDPRGNTGRVLWTNGETNTAAGDTVNNTSGPVRIRAQEEAVVQAEKEFAIVSSTGNTTAINMASNALEAAKEALARTKTEVSVLDSLRPELHKMLVEMHRLFMPNTDLIIVEDNHLTDGAYDSLGAAGGIVSPTTNKRTQAIFVNTSSLLETASASQFAGRAGQSVPALMNIFGHEFGHSLLQQITGSMPAEVLGALQAEHRAWVAKVFNATGSSIGKILGWKTGPGIAQHMKTRSPTKAESPYETWSKSKDKDSELTEEEYNLSFTEWIADAVGKQLSGDSSVLPPVMKRVAPRLSAIMEKFHEKFATFMPETTTETFLKWVAATEQIRTIEELRENMASADDGGPQASQTQTIATMLNHLDIPKEVRDQLNNDMDKYNKIMRWGATLLQLGKANPHVKGLQDYIKAVHEHWVTKSNWNDQAMQTMNAWRALGRKTGDEVGRFLLERTVQSDELKRAMTKSEQAQLLRQMGIDFGKKAEAAQAVIDKVDADYSRALESLYMIEKNRINQDWADMDTRRKGKIAELDQTFDSLRNRNYFPLSRFGVWGVSMKAKQAVTVKGRSYAKGEVAAMELFENKRQRNKGLGKLKREFGPAFQEVPFKIDETLQPFTGLPLSIMRSLKDNPKLGLSEEQKTSMAEMIDTLSPTQAIAKRMLQRKGTAGFSRDAQRAYANYMMQIGGHLAKMAHVGRMEDAIQSVRKGADYLGSQGVINDKRYEIGEHLARHKDYIMNPVNEWGGMRALAFVWFLGYNVKSALVNLTQIPLVAYPYLAARKELTGGTAVKSDVVAIAELTKAMKDARQIFKFGGTNITEQEDNIIQILVAEGIIDESFATELAGLSHADMIQKVMPRETAFTDNVRKGSQAFLRGSTYMFQTAEKFNRRAVALATIRLALKKGMGNEQALSEAREALRTTQFEYARWNRAAFMRGKAGTFFVFMQYLQNVLAFTVQDPGSARYLFMLLMAAGLQGLPGAEDLLDLFDFSARNIKRMGRYEGDPRSDVREDLRELVMTLDASPELIMHGLSAQSFGFGMTSVNDMLGTSLPSLTFEGSISAGRIIPGWESLMNGREVRMETAKDIAGAAITIPMNILEWTRSEDPSMIRGLERMAPSVIKGALKAYRGWTEGELTSQQGNKLVDFDMNNPEHIGELIGMAGGASPTRLVRENERRWAVKEAEMYYATMRQNMQKDYNYAMEERRKTGDQDAVKEIVKTIKWFNRNVPKGQQLTTYGLSYSNWLVGVGKDTAGAERRTLDIPLRRDIDKTFPAATEERIK